MCGLAFLKNFAQNYETDSYTSVVLYCLVAYQFLLYMYIYKRCVQKVTRLQPLLACFNEF